jgi:hypothetical protein
MNVSVKINPMRRHLTTLRIALSFLMARLGERFENAGHLFFHLTTYNKKVGYVEFGIESDDADGILRYRVTGPDRIVGLEEITFSVSNRWLMRRNAKRTSNLMWQIKAAAEIQEGLAVHSVVWGTMAHNRTKPTSPYDLRLLPSDEEIAAHHARLKKVQDWLACHFPAAEEPVAQFMRLPSVEEIAERDAEWQQAQAWLRKWFPVREVEEVNHFRETAQLLSRGDQQYQW